MKTEELKAQGLTDEQIAFVMKENGKDISKLQKERDDLTADRDKWKTQAETAEKTLEGFDGVDVEQLKKDIETYKQKAKDAEDEFAAKINERDFNDALRTALAEIKFTSSAAKTAIESEIKAAGLKLKDGTILGLNDLITQIKAKDASAFVDVKQQQADEGKAKFTQGMSSGSGSTVTKESIMAIKDAKERQQAIRENITLFKS